MVALQWAPVGLHTMVPLVASDYEPIPPVTVRSYTITKTKAAAPFPPHWADRHLIRTGKVFSACGEVAPPCLHLGWATHYGTVPRRGQSQHPWYHATVIVGCHLRAMTQSWCTCTVIYLTYHAPVATRFTMNRWKAIVMTNLVNWLCKFHPHYCCFYCCQVHLMRY